MIINRYSCTFQDFSVTFTSSEASDAVDATEAHLAANPLHIINTQLAWSTEG